MMRRQRYRDQGTTQKRGKGNKRKRVFGVDEVEVEERMHETGKKRNRFVGFAASK